MKPEYTLKIEGLIAKERVVGGLLDSDYVLSVKKRFGDTYEVSVYGKERVDGNGMKPSEGIVVGPTPGATWVSTGSIKTKGITASEINCDPGFLVDGMRIHPNTIEDGEKK